ncbi:hypothetical protein N7474_009351, partial [Penicillium riverlandense]|uniref:uncharacterized protein n=1 Tax=Penicillium riverlandense TaxID=1903569 RepID=UPI00254942B7
TDILLAIETLDPHDLILFDKTYEERLHIRKNLVKEHPQKIIGITNGADPRIRAAIKELYHMLMGNYLPQRYPTIFESKGSSIRNTVTGESWPTSLTDSTPVRLALEILPVNVDEDFFILLPDNQADNKRTAGDEDETTYILEAYSACFPSGFEPQHKLGKRLASIHDPVPGYKERLEKSMDRFFRTLPPGKYVRRVNWAVTVDEELYSNFDKSGNAMTEKFKQLGVDDLDLDKTFLRCERQTLHRLPQSNAIVFAFHTYLYPLEQVKAEGLGEELATAIDGLTRGNTPDIFLYKNGPKWAEAVKQYLRS